VGVVRKLVGAIVTFPIKVLWANYKLYERTVWPKKSKLAAGFHTVDSP